MDESVTVTVHRPPSSIPDNEVPLEELKARFECYRNHDFWDIEDDCRRFAKMITTWRDHELYKYFYDSWEEYLSDHIKRPQEWVDRIVEGVALLDNSKPISAQDAFEAVNRIGRPSKLTADDITKIKEMRDEGMTQQKIADELGVHQSTVMRNCDNITILHNESIEPINPVGRLNKPTDQRGTGQEYLLRKIKTVAPEVLGKIGPGKEFKSVRQAAIHAGIVKPKITVQFDPDESGGQIVSKLYQKLSDDQLKEMLENLLNYFGD